MRKRKYLSPPARQFLEMMALDFSGQTGKVCRRVNPKHSDWSVISGQFKNFAYNFGSSSGSRWRSKVHEFLFPPLVTAGLMALGFHPPFARVQIIDVCYDFSCKTRSRSSSPLKNGAALSAGFTRLPTAAEEREIALSSWLAGGWPLDATLPPIGTRGSILRKTPSFQGNPDCIDESLNITQYMNLFQKQGHMRRHR